jgi:hypothetical protein
VRSVLTGKNMHTVNLCVSFEAAPAARGIRLAVAPVEEHETLTTERSSVVVSLWQESAQVVRGAISHASSGTVAYFQGTEMLLRLAEVLNVRIEP